MYAALGDLKARLGVTYGNIYERDDDAETDLLDANAEVDGCIAKRYAVPVEFADAKTLLKGWVLTLAEERAYARGGAGKLAESVAARVAKVREYLAMTMRGDFQLVGAAENPAGGASISLVVGEEPQMTRENLEGY